MISMLIIIQGLKNGPSNHLCQRIGYINFGLQIFNVQNLQAKGNNFKE